MRISGSKIMATKITGDALESYLKCKTKAHLKLAGHQGSMSDYEGLLVASRQEVRRQAIAKILAQHPETEVARDIPLTAAALRAGPSFVLDTTLEDDLLTLRFAGLKRVEGSSKLGDFHYVPMLFHEGRKVGKEQRLLLELHGLILSQIQGRLPANGVVWHGRECKATRVRLNPDKRRAERFLQEVREMGSAESPTRLILNEHCQVCEFRQRCHDQAVQEDNISLIRGMSERSIRKYQKKGITTLSQLSCTFRPRKNNKREVKNRRPHSFGLQALAVRDGRIYVYGTPDLPTSPVRIYLDVEGDPDRNFVYLIGLVIDEGGAERRHSFWADDEAGEERIFREFLDVVGSYEDFSLFFYGRYETDYLNRMRGRSGSKRLINRLLDGSVNVLRAMYGKVYFPTYSNGLKDVAPALGFSWTEKDASGVQSLVWRHRWERGGGEDFKGKLLAYNIEDCLALKRVTEVLYGIAAAYDEPDGGQPGIGEGGGVPWVKATDALPDYRKWSRVRFACPDFDFINKCSYFDYQRQRVHIRTSRAVRQAEKRRRKGKAKKGLRVSQRVVLRARKCPVCGGPAHQKGRRSFCKLVYDLKITPFGAKRKVIECRAFVHHCPACVLSFMPRKYKRLDRFGHGLKSWAMYLHVAHQISFPKIETLLQDFFGLAVDGPRIYTFKMMLADYYSPTVKRIIQNLVSGGVIYADETEIKLKKTKGYVWVLSNTEEVLYLYRPTREVGFLEKLLHGFAGVLVTDFYPAYDSMGCAQQKCLVHLIRDLNAGLLENPFDEEFKHFAFEFGRLLRSIVTTIDGHGLRRSHLAKHRRGVDHFYRDVVGRAGISEASAKFRDRFTKYRDQMFRFLEHDGVAWNNNYAEHAIKQFAHYRVISDGNMNESGLNGYLALLSVSQTCKNKGVGLLNYFLSGERDIDSYRTGRRCKRQMPSLRPLPDRFYIPWPESLYPDN
jgi:predicted RecB family nuclease